MSLDTRYGNQHHKAGKIGQNRAELSKTQGDSFPDFIWKGFL